MFLNWLSLPRAGPISFQERSLKLAPATDTYASNLGMSIHAQLTKPAHTALQLLLRRGAVAGYLELGLYSLYAPLGLCYL